MQAAEALSSGGDVPNLYANEAGMPSQLLVLY